MCLWEAICSHFLGILQLPLPLAGCVDITGFGCSWEKQSLKTESISSGAVLGKAHHGTWDIACGGLSITAVWTELAGCLLL